MRKRLMLMRGPSGSGKSTIAENLALQCVAHFGEATDIFSADDYFMVDGEYKFKANEICHAHEYCYDKFVSAAHSDVRNIIIDNTNLHMWEYFGYIQYASFMDMEINIYVCDAKFELRRYRNTHQLPNKILKAQQLTELPKHIERRYINSTTTMVDYNREHALVSTSTPGVILEEGNTLMGRVGVRLDSTDCDHVQRISYRVLDISDYNDWESSEYDAAEGPTYITRVHPAHAEEECDTIFDHIAEAHENGHPHVVGG